ncbi:MAG TPA: PDZ domain-containing protein [Verrucomicrobiae bacterium]
MKTNISKNKSTTSVQKFGKWLALWLMVLGIQLEAKAQGMYLGVQVVPHPQGVMVQQVYANSPAMRMHLPGSRELFNLEPGDGILRVNGVQVLGPEHFVALIRNAPPQAELLVGDARTGQIRPYYVILAPIVSPQPYLSQIPPQAQIMPRLAETEAERQTRMMIRSRERGARMNLEMIEHMVNDPSYLNLSKSAP